MKKYEKVPSTSKKGCSVWLIALILVLIFVLLLGGIFYLKYKSNINLKNLSFQKVSLDDSFKKQLDDQKGEKTVQIRLTDADLNKLLNLESSDFPLKNPSVKITPEKIILSGKTSNSPLSLGVAVGIVPKVNNGKIDFDIQEIKTGGVTAPKVVTDSVNSKLSSYLKQFSLKEDVKVTDVKLYDGYLIASGERV